MLEFWASATATRRMSEASASILKKEEKKTKKNKKKTAKEKFRSMDLLFEQVTYEEPHLFNFRILKKSQAREKKIMNDFPAVH
jgi:hypothetical protein